MSGRRTRSNAHPGVSVKALANGRHRLRWREINPDGSKEAQSWTVHGSPTDAERWALAVFEAVQTSGTFERPDDAAKAPVQPARPEVADLRSILVAWLAWRKGMRRMAPGSVALYKSGIRTLTWHLHALQDTAEPDSIPASVLSVDLATRLLDRMSSVPTPCGNGRTVTRPCGPSRRRALLGYLYEAWLWASDEPAQWPGVPTPPRVRTKVVPKHDVSRRPPPAPTWAEMDAILRHAGAGNTQDTLYLQRCTGLRQGQVCALIVSDVMGLDTPTPSLEIRTGKSKQERRGRTVPIAPVLVPLMRRLVAGKPPEAYLTGSRALTASVLQEVFARAEAAGELRAAVWRSDRRENQRTSHSMRAGFQRGLRRADVEDRVIDALVGHAGATTRDRFYDLPDWPELVAAAREVPPVDLVGEVAVGGEVIALVR